MKSLTILYNSHMVVMVHYSQNDISILQGGLQVLLQSIKEQDADKVSVNLQSTLDIVAELETLQVILKPNNMMLS